MSTPADLGELVSEPFDLLAEIERRRRPLQSGRKVTGSASEWVGIGFRIGDEHFVASREQVREVLLLPEAMTRVPGAKRWLLGIANLRGHLLPLVDVKLMFGGGRTALRRTTRVLSVNHREIPAGLIVDEVTGFRRFDDNEYADHWPETSIRCERFLRGAYTRGEQICPVFDLYALIESNLFLRAAAEA